VAGALRSRTLGGRDDLRFSTLAGLCAGLAEAGAATEIRRPPPVRAVSIRAGATLSSRDRTLCTRVSALRSTFRMSRPVLRTIPPETGNRVTFWLRARMTEFCRTGTRA
jgi:hypothetical protein